MIFIHRPAGEEAEMHTQIAHPMATEEETLYLVECDLCGPLGLFSADSVTESMYQHALQRV